MDDVTVCSELKALRHVLERAYNLAPLHANFQDYSAYVFQTEPERRLSPVQHFHSLPLKLLLGVNAQKQVLLKNTLRFTQGKAANNVLLWGARGMGKSSLVKSTFLEVAHSQQGKRLKIVEVYKEDLHLLPLVCEAIEQTDSRVILFCDDLSFEKDETEYKFLKRALDGGLTGLPANCLFYATSNRRHLLERDVCENADSSALNPSDVIHEHVSLSDRFGVWLGFESCSELEFEEMVLGYAAHFHISIERDDLLSQAKLWARQRGSRSGRVAWQFVSSLL